MSSFSSVVRKPGQQILPKVAPRRNVQRHARKPAAPATSALTPDSLPQSPTPEAAQLQREPPVAPHVPTVIATPALSPSPEHSNKEDHVVRTRISTPEPQPIFGVASPTARREVAVPVVAATGLSPNAQLRRHTEPSHPSDPSQNKPSQGQSQQDDFNTPPAKRRKIVRPEAAPPAIQSSLSQPNPGLGAQQRSTNLDPGTDVDLQNVSSRLRAISELANSIETRTRASRSSTGQLSTAETDSEYEEPALQTPRSRSRTSRSAAIEDAASAVIAKAVRGSKKTKARHRRGQTPEDAETHQIDVTETAMADLVTDNGLGKRSETGRRLDNEWLDIKQRWDQKLEQNRSKAKMKPSQRKAARQIEAEEAPAQAPAVVPQMMIVDGQIVTTDESRQVDFSHNIEARANIIDESQIQTDERIYNYVNQNRIGKNAGLRNATKWTEELTDKLYQGLRVFGTDFELITNLFGGSWTRRQIKAKFVREERLHLHKIKEALAQREQVDLNGYGSMIEGGIEGLRDPKEIEAELEAEEKKIRDEYERAKRGDHYAEDEADQPLESIETDQAGEGDAGRTSATPGLEGGRYAGVADRVIKKATQPRKKQPQKQREHTGTSRTGTAGRKGTRGKKPLEGVEERIGNVGDVEL